MTPDPAPPRPVWPNPPAELLHAQRHLEIAVQEWRGGKTAAAAVHLREAISDTAWALFKAQVLSDPDVARLAEEV